MATTLELAKTKNKKAMRDLYNADKNRVYGMLSLLFDNDKEMGDTFLKIYASVWEGLGDQKISNQEEFSAYVMKTAAKICGKEAVKSDPKAFVSKRVNNSVLKEEKTEVFSGDTSKGEADLKQYINKLGTLERLTFVFKTTGKLKSKDIADALRVREAVINATWNELRTAAEATEFLAGDESNSKLRFCEVRSLFGRMCININIPQQTETEALKHIGNVSVRKSMLKPLLIATGCAVAILLACIVYVSVSQSVHTATSSSEVSSISTEETETDQTAEAPTSDYQLDINNVKYYADIDVKDYGKITVALDSNAAPKTVENFVSLAKSGFYNGLTFHRIIEGFMIQGGDPNGDGTGGSSQTIEGEFSNNGISNQISHLRGVISMARSANDNNSASSQFFIVQQDSTFLDGDYAGFGFVTEGMDIVDAIAADAEPTDDNGTITSDKQPIINSVTVREAEEQ